MYVEKKFCVLILSDIKKKYIIYVKLNLMNNFKLLMILSKIKYILNFFKILF